MSTFSARSYWEERLEADWSLRGVGFRRMGRRFNERAYQLRGKRFQEVVEELIPPADRRDVLDVGSGTGFYLNAWTRLGADGLVGMDFSQAAVLNLRGRFPELRIEQADITSGDLELDAGSVGVVSCMDVLFHVVDNPGFRAALENVRALLKPGGYFVWSDLFIHGRELTRNHISWRNIYRIEEILERFGFDIIARRPMFFWMNEPRDSPPLVLWTWMALMGALSSTEATSDLAARILYRIDSALAHILSESPSTEIMVCKKRSS